VFIGGMAMLIGTIFAFPMCSFFIGLLPVFPGMVILSVFLRIILFALGVVIGAVAACYIGVGAIWISDNCTLTHHH